MSKFFKYYRVVEPIEDLRIYKNELFYQGENNRIYSMNSGKVLPEYIDINSRYFKEVHINREYEPSDIIQYKYAKNRHYPHKYDKYKGTITEIDAKGVKVNRKGTSIIDYIDYDMIIRKEEIYWFISSTGKVQSAVIGADKVADTFREKVHNIYKSKHEAQVALEGIFV